MSKCCEPTFAINRRRPKPLARVNNSSWILSDADVAAVLTYVRNAWGHAALPISAGQVSKARHAVIERSD